MPRAINSHGICAAPTGRSTTLLCIVALLAVLTTMPMNAGATQHVLKSGKTHQGAVLYKYLLPYACRSETSEAGVCPGSAYSNGVARCMTAFATRLTPLCRELHFARQRCMSELGSADCSAADPVHCLQQKEADLSQTCRNSKFFAGIRSLSASPSASVRSSSESRQDTDGDAGSFGESAASRREATEKANRSEQKT